MKRLLNVGKNKAVSLFQQMEKLDLIRRRKQGQDKPARMFVRTFVEVAPEKADAPKTSPNFMGWKRNESDSVFTGSQSGPPLRDARLYKTGVRSDKRLFQYPHFDDAGDFLNRALAVIRNVVEYEPIDRHSDTS